MNLIIPWQDNYGEVPLHLSARNGCTELAKLLLAQPSVHVNAVENQDRIPLHWAAMNGHHDIARLLIEAGAEVSSMRCTGQTRMCRMSNRKEQRTTRSPHLFFFFS